MSDAWASASWLTCAGCQSTYTDGGLLSSLLYECSEISEYSFTDDSSAQNTPDVSLSHGFRIIWIVAAHRLARAIRASHRAPVNGMTMQLCGVTMKLRDAGGGG
jgi:hypothetical protein